ncbi:MAG: 5'/3'-nucleotidase SurE [Candidatus Kapaibacteriota bacterium]|jgi:5'-nucleotidase
MSKKLKILVSNDDGIDSPGIFALVESLLEIAEVIVVAPDRQQSAVGHSLTISNPLRVTHFHRDGKMFGYSINGTPSDCVKIAISELVGDRPDLVISGINHGQNTAINILYSGTVSAATEGMLSGIPAMAISLASHSYEADMSYAAKVAQKLALEMVNLTFPIGTLLNVNVPSISEDNIKGMKVVKHNSTIWKDAYERRKDPFGREYYWFSGEYSETENSNDYDDIALSEGYVTINPIHYDITNIKFLNEIKFLEKIY